jgi:hypothetical protein
MAACVRCVLAQSRIGAGHRRYGGHGCAVDAVGFSWDDRFVLSIGSDGATLVWRQYAHHRSPPLTTAHHRAAPHRTASHRAAPRRTAPHRTAPLAERRRLSTWTYALAARWTFACLCPA